MSPVIIRYPLDPTGVSANNLVVGELHQMPARKVRAIATQHGAFYTESLKIRDTATNQLLTPGVQYYATELYELPTARYGKEICAIILITDETVGNEVSLEYQALGGEFSHSTTAILNQIENLDLDNRPVGWGNVLGKPEEFPPSHHLHDIGDVYGFEYIVHAIDRVRAAILMGDDISHDVIYKYIDQADNEIKAALALVDAEMDAHIANKSNPHEVTAAQLSVYLKTEVDALLTALRDQVAANLLAHTSRSDNPHNVTAAQLSVYLKTEVDALLTQLRNDIQSDFNAHIADTSNPHATDKSQVGLGNVQNYGIATTAEAVVEDATALNTKYMTPARVNDRLAIHHAATSTDHDDRYTPRNADLSTSLRELNGKLDAYIGGVWRTIWPPQWQ